MKITQLSIKNFKSVEELVIRDIEDVLILVGRNNAGKSVMLDAIRAVSGDYAISEADFHHRDGNITIGIQLLITDEDLEYLHPAVISSSSHCGKKIFVKSCRPIRKRRMAARLNLNTFTAETASYAIKTVILKTTVISKVFFRKSISWTSTVTRKISVRI